MPVFFFPCNLLEIRDVIMQARLDLINSIQFDESDLMGKGMELLGRQIELQL